MSRQLINRSPDLKKLQNEGYDLEIRSGYLLVHSVPYVDSNKNVMRGTLVAKLVLAGDKTAKPDDHVAYFMGDHPCESDGNEIAEIKHQSGSRELAKDVVIQHSFSAKPKPNDVYPDYHAKMSTYAALLSGPAQLIDPSAKPQTFKVTVVEEKERDTPFNYVDTASTRAEIDLVTDKLKKLKKIAIIGLGGTGSYILDLLAKTPVWEIHLYDGDKYLQHNAFRSPGAPSRDELEQQPNKATWFRDLYSKMHSGIIDHPVFIDAANIDELRDMDFVFVCVDDGEAKKFVVEKLEDFELPFIDVGLGVQLTGDSLGGIVRVTSSTEQRRGHFRDRVSFEDLGNNEYNRNIQIAELNSLNAALAVIKWKKLFGYYRDMKSEHHTQFHIDTNGIVNEERPE
ncbi:MAG: ThiF family adenylyltransferase [Cyanobacteria bacterium SZAS LIN-3]|nr:ThiF family adenylyltransferase [Cyanobacteria bacterium SZAS LIN-3]